MIYVPILCPWLWNDLQSNTRRAVFQIFSGPDIFRSRELPQRTKIRISNSNIKSVLLYSDEAWRITRATVTKVQIFLSWVLSGVRRTVYCPFPFLAGHSLDHENDHEAEKEWNPLDIMVPVRWLGFCWWSGLTFPQTSTNGGQDN